MNICTKMATSSIGFRWLDLLEKEFDKACVELDTSLSELETEEPEVVLCARQKITTLSSCFAQLTHKALTVFQNSAKLEAELVNMRTDLVQARAANIGMTIESPSTNHMSVELSQSRAESAQLAKENTALRETILALHAELFGARLATKYLDKELAGRIQQLQLLGRDMRSDIRDSLWAQVEAEILLQRHKTLVRVCRGVSGTPRSVQPLKPRRMVKVTRSPHLGLGISVTGGREHGVPILISELEKGGPAEQTGELFVGDAILAINDVDLTKVCHKEAVQALQSVKGDCALCVQFIASDEEDKLSEDNYRFPLYPDEGEYSLNQDGGGATPTAPRTPDYNNRQSRESSICESETPLEEYPTNQSYPEYNSINNNLSILDMDDDNIKIETQIIEQVQELVLDSPPHTARPIRTKHKGQYRSIADFSSNTSQETTPVHGKRFNKKRNKFDWKNKGAYKSVDDDQSSEEAQHNGDINQLTSINPLPSINQERKEPLVSISPEPVKLELVKRSNDKKGFRLGLARRVSEVNGLSEKYPVQLLAGDGDPNFGTPV